MQITQNRKTIRLKFNDAEGNGSTKLKRCKVPFLVKSENYLIGNPSLLLYTRQKEEIDHLPSMESQLIRIFV
jgi:hypothetical protein